MCLLKFAEGLSKSGRSARASQWSAHARARPGSKSASQEALTKLSNVSLLTANAGRKLGYFGAGTLKLKFGRIMCAIAAGAHIVGGHTLTKGRKSNVRSPGSQVSMYEMGGTFDASVASYRRGPTAHRRGTTSLGCCSASAYAIHQANRRTAGPSWRKTKIFKRYGSGKLDRKFSET